MPDRSLTRRAGTKRVSAPDRTEVGTEGARGFTPRLCPGFEIFGRVWEGFHSVDSWSWLSSRAHSACSSDAPGVGPPDELVKLEPEANVLEAVGENPLGHALQVDLAVDR